MGSRAPMAATLAVVAALGSAFAASNGSLSGRVLDATAGDPLGDVILIAQPGAAEKGRSALSGADGTFTIPSLAPGSYQVTAARVGYRSATAGPIRVSAGAQAVVEIRLEREDITEEVVVRPEAAAEPSSPRGLSREDAKELPGTLGDPIRGLTTIPGVAGINDFKSEIRIRGGETEDTVFRLDGVTVADPYHFPWARGSVAALNPDAFDRFIVLTSGLDAGIGDTVSGAVVMSPSERGSDGRFLNLSAGTLLSNLTSGGGLAGDGSWIAAGRYSNLALYRSLYNVESVDVPSFGDLFVRARLPISGGSDLIVGALGIVNSLSTTDPKEDKSNSLDARAGIVYAGVDTVLSGGERLTSRIAWSGARRTVFTTEGDDLRSWEERTRLSFDAASAPGMFRWRGGVEGSFFKGTIDGAIQTIGALQPLAENSQRAGAYGSYAVDPPGGWTLEAGVRADWDSLAGWTPVSPRLSLSRSLPSGWSWHVSATRTTQFPRISQRFLAQGRPLETTMAHELAGEVLVPLPHGMEIDLGAFYRRQWDLTHELVNRFPDLPEPMARFSGGRTSGFEMALLRDAGRFRGRAALTMLNAVVSQGGTEYLRNGDQPYFLNAWGMYLFNERWNVSSRFQAAAGLPYSSYEPLGEGRRELGLLNGRRLPATARLDVRITREWRPRGTVARFFIELDNVLARKNVRGRDFRWDSDTRQFIFHDEEAMPLLPGIGFEMSWGGR